MNLIFCCLALLNELPDLFDSAELYLRDRTPFNSEIFFLFKAGSSTSITSSGDLYQYYNSSENYLSFVTSQGFLALGLDLPN
jgi:hypothetical protein